MKRIVLIRHAKSSWQDDAQDDLDRPLNERGRKAISDIARWLKEYKVKPDFVWLSPATRCQETWHHLRKEWDTTIKATQHRALYMADPKTMLEVLKLTSDDIDTVALVGHQPGISAATRKLADGKETKTLARAYSKFPTAAVAVLETPVQQWADLDFKSARFQKFIVPKELA